MKHMPLSFSLKSTRTPLFKTALLFLVTALFSLSVKASEYELRVHLEPSQVNSAGARWSVTPYLGTWYQSGTQVLIEEGEPAHALQFSQVYGYYSPTDYEIIVNAHSNKVTYFYTEWSNPFQVNPVYGDGPYQGGSFAEAGWSILTRPATFTNYVSGFGATPALNCPTGTYSLVWSNYPGYDKPAQIITNIFQLGHDAAIFQGVYRRQVGDIRISRTPIDVTNAVFEVIEYPDDYFDYTDSPLVGTNSAILTNAPVGDYVIRWSTISGWRTPIDNTFQSSKGLTEVDGRYGRGARLSIQIYQHGEAIPLNTEVIDTDSIRWGYLDGLGAGEVIIEPEGTPDGAGGFFYTPGDLVTITAVPTNCFPDGIAGQAYDSFFFEMWHFDNPQFNSRSSPIKRQSYTLSVGTRNSTEEEDVEVGVIFSRGYYHWDNAGDLDHDMLPDEWELHWELNPKDPKDNNGPRGNLGNNFIPSVSTNPAVSVAQSFPQTLIYYSHTLENQGYPLPKALMATHGYNSQNTEFNNLLQCRGLDGHYKTNGPSGWVANDDPNTDPNVYSTAGSPFDDGWLYYFWYWRSADSAANGIENSFGLDWVTFHHLKYNDPSNDTDNDGLTDIEEFALRTDPTHSDTDADGMDDWWENEVGLDPLNYADARENPDNDYYALSGRLLIEIEDEIEGTPMTLPLYYDGDAEEPTFVWIDVADDGIFDILLDTILLAPIDEGVNLLNGTAGIAYDPTTVFYGTSTAEGPYQKGLPVWVGNQLYDEDAVDIVNPPKKHLYVYLKAPALGEPFPDLYIYPGFTSFRPTTGWAINGSETAAYINYEEYLGGDYLGRIVWDANGLAWPRQIYNDDHPLTLGRDKSTDPFSEDTDGDGIPDGWELYVGLDPNFAGDAGEDDDGDGLSNLQEWANTTHPLSNSADSWENKPLPTDPGVAYAMDLLHPFNDPHPADTDWDGLPDGAEQGWNLNPTSVDTDGDGLPDGWEIYAGTDPLVPDANMDTDGDGLLNWQEYWTGTVPEWMLCDPSWNFVFLSRSAMHWDPVWNTFPFFIPPAFMSCPSFLFNNMVYNVNQLEDLLVDFPAAEARGHAFYKTTLAGPDNMFGADPIDTDQD
ncbi:MAG: hypothetical protein GX811_08540, partial [Lentisphaerae bacterium]|nr:hypothetical protein [Lentisphaerota bacterium]